MLLNFNRLNENRKLSAFQLLDMIRCPRIRLNSTPLNCALFHTAFHCKCTTVLYMTSWHNTTNQKLTFAQFVKKYIPLYGIRKSVTVSPQLFPTLGQMNLFHIRALYSFKIHFNITVPPTIIQISSRVSVRIACHESCALDPSHCALVFVTIADMYIEMQSSKPQNCSERVTECNLAMA